MHNLIEEIGAERVKELLALRNKTTKADRLFFERKIEEYSALLKEVG